MREVVFVDGARSAFTNLGGGLRELASTEIAGLVIKALVKKTGIMEKGNVDALFCGNALRDLKASAIARYAALAGGLPVETAAHYVEMQCGSAITSINHAASMIATGFADVCIVGGMESYSTMTCQMDMNIPPYKLQPPLPLPFHLSPIPEEDIDMIHVSDAMAKKWNISREQCDEFSVRSQARLQDAYKKGITGKEIVPIVFPATKKTPEIVVDKDEFPKAGTTMEALSGLRTVLPGGVTTAGNASGRNDGAAFVLMMSADKAKELGYQPMARWIIGADHGVPAGLMGIGPAYSNLKALKKADLKIADMDVIECNEAFAAQNLGVIAEMEAQSGEKIDQAKWNPNGGAISIGHPNGASGARICMFAMNQLIQTGGKYGIFGSCCGGGHGTSTVIENLMR